MLHLTVSVQYALVRFYVVLVLSLLKYVCRYSLD